MFKNRLVEDLLAHLVVIIIQAALGYAWMKIGHAIQSKALDKIESTNWARKSKKDK